MTESLNTWVARLAPEPLPVMRRTLTRVRDLLDRPSASNTALKQVIEFDPGFSLHIFRSIEELPHRPKEPVNKLANAISLLGMHKIEQALDRLPALEDRLKGPPRRNQLDCYSRAAHASIYAAELARRLRFRDPETLASAALLQDLGEMALGSAAPEIMRRIRQLMQQGLDRDLAALEVLGFTLNALNQQLSNRWRLPELARTALEPYNSFLPEPLTVMLACAVARDSANTWTGQEISDHLELLGEFLEITPDNARAQLHQTAAMAARKLQDLTLPLPAFSLLYYPQQSIRMKTPAARPAVKTSTKPAPPPPAPEKTVKPAPLPPTPKQTVRPAPPPPTQKTTTTRAAAVSEPPPDDANAAATNSNPLHQKLIQTVDAMLEQYGLRNVMFCMLSADKSRLIARMVFGERAQTHLKGFQVDLQPSNLFTLLMQKPQVIWLKPGNLEKYQRLIPESQLEQLCKKGLLMMSIFIKNKPVGLFYADNGCGREALSDRQHQNFKALCRRFMQDLS